MREDFLATQFKYEPAPKKLISVSRFLKQVEKGFAGPLCLGGRLELDADRTIKERRFFLSSQGQKIEVSVKELNLLSQSGSFPAANVLKTGDVVCIFVGEFSFDENKKLIGTHCCDIQLLAPNLSDEFVLPQNVSDEIILVQRWREFLQFVRNFFLKEGFVEAETPTLVPCPGMEPELYPFQTNLNIGKLKQNLFLPTSPEIHLKRLLVRGYSEVFEIKKCFRNGELSDHHEPEFWMLEWYRAFSNIQAIQEDLLTLIMNLDNSGFVIGEIGELKVESMKSLFSQALEFDLTPKTTSDELMELARSRGVDVGECRSFNDIFHLLFLIYIEPHLGKDGPTVVKDFPPSQAALARLNDAGWADRFELYWRGMEIGNAFHELNDPKEQTLRWEKDFQTRRELGVTEVPLDQEFLRDLHKGLPPSGGIAVGLERLFLACLGLDEIKKIKAFPHRERLRPFFE